MNQSQQVKDSDDAVRSYDIRLKKFLCAVAEDKRKYVAKKLSAGAFHVDARDGDFVTSLLLASMFGYLEMVKLLLSFGARVNEGNQIGITPVHTACSRGHLKILHELLKAGGDMRPSDMGITPMGMACAHGQLEIVKYLLAGGMNLETVPGSISPSPLMLAAINNQEKVLIYFLLPNIRESQKLKSLPSETQETLDKMLEDTKGIPKIDIDAPVVEFFHLNLLALAVVTHNRPLFELLVELGANMRLKLHSGRTVIEVAKRYEFDIWQSFSESMRSKNMDKTTSEAASFTNSRGSRRSVGSTSSANSKKKMKVRKLKRLGDFFAKFL